MGVERSLGANDDRYALLADDWCTQHGKPGGIVVPSEVRWRSGTLVAGTSLCHVPIHLETDQSLKEIQKPDFASTSNPSSSVWVALAFPFANASQ